uniref:RHS repeat-associated core domain-containing protein n=1 Tax=Streptomyces sp. NRRL F-2664 TaxID=1463842 RepID=UPI00131BE3BB
AAHRAADPAANPFRFGGEYTNTENGTHYTPARLYHPETGRFTTRDPHPTPLNKYQAFNANPVNGIDPTGNLTVRTLRMMFTNGKAPTDAPSRRSKALEAVHNQWKEEFTSTRITRWAAKVSQTMDFQNVKPRKLAHLYALALGVDQEDDPDVHAAIKYVTGTPGINEHTARVMAEDNLAWLEQRASSNGGVDRIDFSAYKSGSGRHLLTVPFTLTYILTSATEALHVNDNHYMQEAIGKLTALAQDKLHNSYSDLLRSLAASRAPEVHVHDEMLPGLTPVVIFDGDNVPVFTPARAERNLVKGLAAMKLNLELMQDRWLNDKPPPLPAHWIAE